MKLDQMLTFSDKKAEKTDELYNKWRSEKGNSIKVNRVTSYAQEGVHYTRVWFAQLFVPKGA